MEKTEKRRNIKMQFIIIGIYLLLTMSGLILMKLGGNTGKFAMVEGDINFGISPISLLGFICYIGSFFLYTRNSEGAYPAESVKRILPDVYLVKIS